MRRSVHLALGVAAAVLLGGGHSGSALAQADGEKLWVTSDRLNRRTCPAEECGVVGQLFFREAATVHERRNGWARITRMYSADCIGGRNRFVERGNDACTERNGVVDGQMAEWVSLDYLSAERPPDPSEGAEGLAAIVGQSDDFRIHESAFTEAARELLSSGRCTEQQIRDHGGFWKSTNRSGAIYFIYCGESNTDDRYYLNAETGEIFQ